MNRPRFGIERQRDTLFAACLGLGAPLCAVRLVGRRGDPLPACQHRVVAAHQLGENSHPQQREEAQGKEDRPPTQLTLAPTPGTEAKPGQSSFVVALHRDSVGAASKPGLRSD